MSRSVVTLPPQGHYLRKRVRSASFARHAAGFSLFLLVIAIPIYRIGGITAPALIAVLLLAGFLALLSLLIAVLGIARVWFGEALGGGKAFRAALLALVALLPFGGFVFLASANPNTNVAYTEAFAPSVADAIGLAEQSSGVGGALSNTVLPSVIATRRYALPAPEVAAAAQTVLASLGWEVSEFGADMAAADEADDPLGVIRSGEGVPIPTPRADSDRTGAQAALPDRDTYRAKAVARDLLLALPSDVDIRIATDGEGTAVDVRSLSRETGIDLGQNRRFIETFFSALDTELAGPEAVAGG